MFEFDINIDRKDTDSAKWGKYHGKDIIPMWVADMDFQSPPMVIDALHQRIAHGVFGYAMPPRALVESIVSYLQRAFNWQVEPNWLVWLPGLVTGLNVACRSTMESGEGVLTSVPIYPPFLSAPKFSNRILQTTRLVLERQKWRWDYDHFEDAIDDKTRLFILCNPHNPTGRVFRREELIRLADICLNHGLVICSDEIHCDLVLDPDCRHLPIASLSPEIAARTITLMAPSKTYNLPGLSFSYAIIPDNSLRRRFKLAMSGIVPHVNSLGMTAAQAAYDQGQPWLDALIAYLRSNRDLVQQTIQGISRLEMSPGEATYLAWIDARRLNETSPAKWLEQSGVGLSDGHEFDGRGFVRLNFGCPRALLTQALNRIARFVGTH